MCAFLNSTSIMELDRVPEHLVVLGGGYVGLEFGQMFRRFGSHVTIVQSAATVAESAKTPTSRRKWHRFSRRMESPFC